MLQPSDPLTGLLDRNNVRIIKLTGDRWAVDVAQKKCFVISGQAEAYEFAALTARWRSIGVAVEIADYE